MNDKEVLEGNKLIAEFMGYKLITPEMRKRPSTWKYSYWEYKPYDVKFPPIEENNLKYHKSWEWLIPTLTKIGILFDDNPKIRNVKIINFLDWDLTELLIEEVYQTIVNFIKWYNKNK